MSFAKEKEPNIKRVIAILWKAFLKNKNITCTLINKKEEERLQCARSLVSNYADWTGLIYKVIMYEEKTQFIKVEKVFLMYLGMKVQVCQKSWTLRDYETTT